MKSDREPNVLELSHQITVLLHFQGTREQEALSKIAELCQEIQRGIQQRLSHHLNPNFALGFFTRDREKSGQRHVDIIKLHELTSQPPSNVNEALSLLMFIEHIKSEYNDNKLQPILSRINIGDYEFDIFKTVGEQKVLLDYLLSILHNDKLIRKNDALTNEYSSDITTTNTHFSAAYGNLKHLITLKCLSVLTPTIEANAIHLIHHIKDIQYTKPNELIKQLNRSLSKNESETQPIENNINNQQLIIGLLSSYQATQNQVEKSKFALSREQEQLIADIMRYKLETFLEEFLKQFSFDDIGNDDKLEFLDRNSLPFHAASIINNIHSDLRDFIKDNATFDNIFKHFSNASETDSRLLLLIQILRLQFTSYLAFLEKQELLAAYHAESKNILGSLDSTRDQHLRWYRDNILEAVTEEHSNPEGLKIPDDIIDEDEINQIIAEERGRPGRKSKANRTRPPQDKTHDYTNTLSRTQLLEQVDNVFLNFLIHRNIDKIYTDLDNVFDRHIETHLKASSFALSETNFIEDWKRTLSKTVDQFKRDLQIITDSLSHGTNEHTDPRIVALIEIVDHYVKDIPGKEYAELQKPDLKPTSGKLSMT